LNQPLDPASTNSSTPPSLCVKDAAAAGSIQYHSLR
jgi:hypothetical protein